MPDPTNADFTELQVRRKTGRGGDSRMIPRLAVGVQRCLAETIELRHGARFAWVPVLAKSARPINGRLKTEFGNLQRIRPGFRSAQRGWRVMHGRGDGLRQTGPPERCENGERLSAVVENGPRFEEQAGIEGLHSDSPPVD